MPAPALTLAQKMELLFRDPLVEPETQKVLGTLYLLRRDIRDLMMGLPERAIWPRTMAVLAGIDLLAKFYSNDDGPSGVGDRIRTFVRERMTRTHSDPTRDAEAIYQLRNSLLHSFGLYSRGGGRIYRFTVTRGPSTTLVENDSADPERWTVDLSILQQRFEAAVSEYRDMLNAGTAPFAFSEALFDKYGWVSIG